MPEMLIRVAYWSWLQVKVNYVIPPEAYLEGFCRVAEAHIKLVKAYYASCVNKAVNRILILVYSSIAVFVDQQ